MIGSSRISEIYLWEYITGDEKLVSRLLDSRGVPDALPVASSISRYNKLVIGMVRLTLPCKSRNRLRNKEALAYLDPTSLES
jgi:hypothetical protein